MIVIDIEATGKDPKNCSILSIGAVAFFHSNNQFYTECRIRKNAYISAKALKYIQRSV